MQIIQLKGWSALNHLPMGMRIFQVHVERGRIGCADPSKSPLTAPEFHAAFEVRVENPHAILSPQKALDRACFLLGHHVSGRDDKGEVRVRGECDAKKTGIKLGLMIKIRPHWQRSCIESDLDNCCPSSSVRRASDLRSECPQIVSGFGHIITQ